LGRDIYKTLLIQLRKVWSHYLKMQFDATNTGSKQPSTSASSPAPGRRLLIVRDDSAPISASFSALLGSTEPTTYQKYTSLETVNQMAALPDPPPSKTQNNKKRWTFLRGLFASNEEIRPMKRASSFPAGGSNSPKVSTPENSRSRPSTPPNMERGIHRSFKFSLEWSERPSNSRDRKLYPPCLPPSSHGTLSKEILETGLSGTSSPAKHELAASKYCGIALAEWSALIGECQGFYERRKFEGVMNPRFVETPTLGVETFRKPIG
jgi:hypothetical protein